MANVERTPSIRARYVRDCLLRIRDFHRDQLRVDTRNPRARYSYGAAAAVIAGWLDRSPATVKIWASIDKRDIPTPELKALKEKMRIHYG
jgi:hypothetical protein